MWGIIPAAGQGSRIQPLAFSKELLPIGSVVNGAEERPRAVSEYLVERMAAAGVDKICVVISPGKSDIMDYFGEHVLKATMFYAVQQRPLGLCDAIFRALPLIAKDEHVCIGLPDTIWFPKEGLTLLPNGELSLLLFPTQKPQHFDAVETDEEGNVLEVQVKAAHPRSHWIWGAMKMPGSVLHELYELWRYRQDEFLGTLFNAYFSCGGKARGFKFGESYVDVGTLNGYREALQVLDRHAAEDAVNHSARR